MTITKIDPESVLAKSRTATEGGAKAPPSSFLQTPFWGSFKAAHGWQPNYFRVEAETDENTVSFDLSVLVRPLFRVASIAYIPLGPAVDIAGPARQSAFLAELSEHLAPMLPSNTIFIRFDPPWCTTVCNTGKEENEASGTVDAPARNDFPAPLPRPARKAPAHIQPPDTVILDLSKTEDSLLAEMKSKWRYNVRLGEKKGVSIRSLDGERGSGEGIELFYALYLETASRDGISIHSKKYYRDLVARAASASSAENPVSVRVYLAEHEGAVLASIITLFCGCEAVYLYGASSNEKRNLMPAYSLQWKAIRDAKAAGCTRYDFYGMPPTDDPSHPMHGLYRFKTGFGGSIVHRVGSYDIPLRPVRYTLYRTAEAARTFWFKRIVKIFRREIRPTS
jgi:lipid II:glycine glycyltransferase (peptidoglycan interpeptide bridge formation enzyme)